MIELYNIYIQDGVSLVGTTTFPVSMNRTHTSPISLFSLCSSTRPLCFYLCSGSDTLCLPITLFVYHGRVTSSVSYIHDTPGLSSVDWVGVSHSLPVLFSPHSCTSSKGLPLRRAVLETSTHFHSDISDSDTIPSSVGLLSLLSSSCQNTTSLLHTRS